MAIAFILFAALVIVANGNITGRAPTNGTCLCFTGNPVNVRSAACGQRIIGSATFGQCFKYTGSNRRCSLNNNNYRFFRIDYNGNRGWSAGNFLSIEPESRCSSPGVQRPAALSLTDLYNSRVMSAQRYERPLDFRASNWIKNTLSKHCGVVVTLPSGQRWLVHKEDEFEVASQTVVVDTRHMSSDWSLKATKSVHNSRVTDYVSAGGAYYNLILDNCIHACNRMMDLS